MGHGRLCRGLAAGRGLNWAGRPLQGMGAAAVLPAALLLTLGVAAAGLLTQEEVLPGGQSGAERGQKRRPAAALRKACTASPALPVLLGSTLFTGVALALIETFWQPAFYSAAAQPEPFLVFGGAGLCLLCCFGAGQRSGGPAAGRAWPARGIPCLRRAVRPGVAALSFTATPLAFGLLYLALYLAFGIATTAQSVAINADSPPEVRATLLSGQGFALQIGGFAASLGASLLPIVWACRRFWQWGCGTVFGGDACYRHAAAQGAKNKIMADRANAKRRSLCFYAGRHKIHPGSFVSLSQ